MVLVDRLGIQDTRACQSESEFLKDHINAHEEDADLTDVTALSCSQFFPFCFDEFWSRELNKNLGFRWSESDAGEVTMVIPKDFYHFRVKA